MEKLFVIGVTIIVFCLSYSSVVKADVRCQNVLKEARAGDLEAQAVDCRDTAEQAMTQEQIAKAQRLASE